MNVISSQIAPNVASGPVVVPATGAVQDTGAKSSMVQNYIRLLLRWRWPVIGSIVACAFLGVLATFLMTPKYTAVSTIEISRESNQVTGFQGVERDASVADQEFYQTQYGLLRARSLAERVAVELNLVDNVEFFESSGATLTGPAFKVAGGRYPVSGRPERQRVAGEVLLNNVSIWPTRLSRLVDIGYTSKDPAFSAKVANAWAENFIEANLNRKVQATSYGREALQRQLSEFKERLDASQRQLVAYASQQQIINLPSTGQGENGATSERSLVADDLASLNTELNKAIADRIDAEARLNQAGRNGASANALTNPAINSLRQRRAELGAEYQNILIRFEPDYPAAQAIKAQLNQLDRAIATEEGRVSQSLQSAYRAAREREQALRTSVNALKGDYLDLRRRSIQYNIYQQEVDTNRALYDGLLQRFKEIGVAGGVGVNNVSIVDTADVPDKPSSPRPLLNLAIALVAGAALGIALAFALEQLDEAIVDPSEFEGHLGLPLLGAVPRVEQGTTQEAIRDPKSDLFDAYLAVQTNLGFTTEHGLPRSLAVTSTRPAEGKSTTALALASTIARSKKKVILLDGDMRSPSVHQLAGVGHDRGLSNYLAGDDDIDTMTFRMDDLGLVAMSAGPLPPNAAELLTGSRLSLLISRLLQTYDHVVIDSPPVMGLADAPLIASKVEGVVFAVEAHGIRSSQVKTALARLQAANARIAGGILTKFNTRRAGYGYGYEYGYSYGRSDSE